MTPDIFSSSSCLDLLLQNHFNYITEYAHTLTLSDDELDAFFLEQIFIPTPLILELTTALVALQKMEYFTKVAPPHLGGVNSNNRHELSQIVLQSLFDADIFPELFKYQPHTVEKLLEFQTRFNYPDSIYSNTIYINRFTTRMNFFFGSEPNREDLNPFFQQLFIFINTLYSPTTITPEEDYEPFFSMLCIILIRFILSKPSEHFVHEFAKKCLCVPDEALVFIFNIMSANFFPLQEIDDTSKLFLSLLFKNPQLSSFALSENKTQFLEFCNFENDIQTHPHLFI